MGYLSALGFLDSGVSVDTALAWHLQSNHYPPVPSEMVAPCKLAIEAFHEGDYHKMIELPEGISYRGNNKAPASAIVEQHHLDAWVYQDEDEMSDLD